MDKIIIEDLEIFCNHGVYQEENVLGQKFLVCAVLYTDVHKAAKNDNLEYSINYGDICLKIEAFMKEHTFQLIETVADQLAQYLLLNTRLLQRIEITVKKPWAPIGIPIKTVAVCLERMWHTAYIALGSNLGHRKAFLDQAANGLNETEGCKAINISEYFNTSPVGGVEQEDFLNGCLEIKTILEPYELLAELQKAEERAGRERIIRWGPRTLDLDLLFYDDLVMDTERLTIPHKEMHKRKFVLEPLCQIAPCKRHPIIQKTVSELLEKL